jgi:histidinol-phosphate aminotransferase
MDFSVLDSSANFLFAKSERIGGEELYRKLKAQGILIRHFTSERIKDYNRITIGTRQQMDSFLAAVKSIIKENEK